MVDPVSDKVSLASPYSGSRPTFRWLQAKSKLNARFLMFVTKVPAGFDRVDDVRLEGASLVIENKKSNRRITLPFSNHALIQ